MSLPSDCFFLSLAGNAHSSELYTTSIVSLVLRIFSSLAMRITNAEVEGPSHRRTFLFVFVTGTNACPYHADRDQVFSRSSTIPRELQSLCPHSRPWTLSLTVRYSNVRSTHHPLDQQCPVSLRCEAHLYRDIRSIVIRPDLFIRHGSRAARPLVERSPGRGRGRGRHGHDPLHDDCRPSRPDPQAPPRSSPS